MKHTRFRDGTRYGKRHVPGEMNQTESLYAEELQALKLEGKVVEWFFEAMTFKLAAGSRYTPDFAVLYADGVLEFVDVKGGGPMDRTSLAKIKYAADKFPFFRFVIEKRKAKKDGGGWERMEK